jgi:hypothetical protein
VAQGLWQSLAHSAWHQDSYDDAGGVLPACQQIHIHNAIFIIKTENTFYGYYFLTDTGNIQRGKINTRVTNYSQQDATFLEFIYFYRHSTCLRRKHLVHGSS